MNEKIDIIKLKNGFNCCFREISLYGKIVTMALVVRVGSALEHNGERGIAHLLEHLLMSFVTFDLYCDVRYRAKAYTDFNETIFFIKCPVDENNIRSVLNIIYEIAQGKFVNEKFFERAKSDVLKEIREEQNKISIVKILLKNTEYLSCLALGNEDDVLKMKYEDVKHFFEQYYSADIMSLSIVGDISAGMKENVIDLFTNLDSTTHTCYRKNFYIPDYKDQVEYVNISKDNLDNSELIIIFKTCKEVFESKEDIIRAEIVEKIALEILTTELTKYLKQQKVEIKYDHKELDNSYIFYIFKIKTEDLGRNNIQILVDELIYFFGNVSRQDISNEIIYTHIVQFFKIEYNEELYYQEVGMHQLLLECIDHFIAQNFIMTYKERYMLYEKKSKEIIADEIYMFLEMLKRKEKIFIVI